MTVCADNLTLVNLPFYLFESVAFTSEHRHVRHFISQMVEFEHNNIALITINTGMATQVFDQERVVNSRLFQVSDPCLLDIGCAICLIMRPNIDILATPAHRLVCSTRTIAYCEVVYWLGGRAAFGTYLQVHESTISSSGQSFNTAD
jgi:hypothetical protein